MKYFYHNDNIVLFYVELSIIFCFALSSFCLAQHLDNSSHLFPIVEHGKLGFINVSGRKVIEPQFDFSLDSYLDYPVFSDGLAAIKIGEKWGYIDTLGNVVIPAEFDFAGNFNNGFAEVNIGGTIEVGRVLGVFNTVLGGRWGLINKTGDYIFPPKAGLIKGCHSWDDSLYCEYYETGCAFDFHEGLSLVRIGEVFGYIDINGMYAITPKFVSAGDFHNGYAKVMYKGKWGYINKSGQYIVKPQFDEAFDFHYGLARISIRDSATLKYGYIDTTGKIVIPAQFDIACDFNRGMARVGVNIENITANRNYVEKDKYRRKFVWGYIDRTGKYKIKPQFDIAEEFSEGLARVSIHGKIGYIDTTGKLQIPAQFFDGYDFNEGMARVRVNEMMGYIDTTGKFIVPPRFTFGRDFSEGYAAVCMDCIWETEVAHGGKWGYVNRIGKLVIPMEFDYAESFSNGLARVSKDGKLGYIDRMGNYVWIEP